MLRNLTKECYLCLHKDRHRNLNTYPNIYPRESIFLLKGNSTIQFNYRNDRLEKIKDLRKNGSFVYIPSEGFFWQ